MKRFLAVLLSLIVGMAVLSLAACSDNTGDENRPVTGEEQETAGDNDGGSEGTTGPQTPAVGNPDNEYLIAYFSASGHTEEVAGYIAEATGGDLFELIPSEPYTSDDLNYTDHESRVYREYLDESLRDVELTDTAVDNWADYDVVFIGYPIWWGIAAWPVNDFVEDNDFTGKTVIPFCTSASSGLGESGQILAELAGTGTWLAGERFSSRPSESAVTSWLEGLGVVQ